MKEAKEIFYAPECVRLSTRFTGDEKDLYYHLYINRNPAGFCVFSNAELAKHFGVSDQTITARLGSMQKKNLIHMVINVHTHKRIIWPQIPGQPALYGKPIETLEAKAKEYFALALQKSMIFGDVSLDTLVEKVKSNTYLDDVTDSKYQFALTDEQILFLAWLKQNFPDKKIDCQLAAYADVDFNELKYQIKHSELLQSNNISLRWIMDHQAEVLRGDYKKFDNIETLMPNKSNFQGRQYTREEMNAMFQDIDKVEV